MDILFVRQGEYEKGDAAFSLIRKAVRSYLAENGEDVPDDPDLPDIRRTDENRPYPEWPDGNTVDISVTHSGDIWMCLVSSDRCGIDFQYLKSRDTSGLSARYYTEGERKYAEESAGGFFEVWVRREALGKYEGHGFFGDYPDSAPGGVPADTVCFKDAAGGDALLRVHIITEEMLSAAGVYPGKEFRAAAVTKNGDIPAVRRI